MLALITKLLEYNNISKNMSYETIFEIDYTSVSVIMIKMNTCFNCQCPITQELTIIISNLSISTYVSVSSFISRLSVLYQYIIHDDSKIIRQIITFMKSLIIADIFIDNNNLIHKI